MKRTGLIALLLATALAVIAAVVVSFPGDNGAANPEINQVVLPEVGKRLGEVARVTLVHGLDKTTLLRRGDNWVVDEKGDYPADGVKLHKMLLALAELRYVEPKTHKSELYPRLEVEDAGKKDAKSTLVTVSDEKGSLLGEIIAGKRRIDQLGSGTDGVYVRKPGNAQSWLASGSLDVSGDTTQWLEQGIIDIAREKVKEVRLIQPDGAALDIVHDKPDAALSLKDAPASAKLKGDDPLVEPTTALASLTLSDVRPASEIPLEGKGVSHAEFTTFDGLTLKVALIDKDGKSWAHFEASGSGEAAKTAEHLNAKLGAWIYAIPEYKAKALRTKLADVIQSPKPS